MNLKVLVHRRGAKAQRTATQRKLPVFLHTDHAPQSWQATMPALCDFSASLRLRGKGLTKDSG